MLGRLLSAVPFIGHTAEMAVRVESYGGPRTELRSLFELAEDSASELDGYIEAGTVLVALDGDEIAGHLQLTDTTHPADAEIKNMAVLPSHQRRGIGRALVEAAARTARSTGRASLLVATAAADTGNLRFYQRCGFRMRAVERDAFTEANGYASHLRVDGIELRDRVWLDKDLNDGSPVRSRIAMQLRVARHTEHLAEVATFYRDGIGLREVGGFRDHDGYDGIFLAVPGTGTHLELTSGGAHGAPAPHPETLFVVLSRQPGRGRVRGAATACGPGGSSQPVLGRARHHYPGPGRLPGRVGAGALERLTRSAFARPMPPEWARLAP